MYAAVFHSGNRTASVSEGAVCDTQVPGIVQGPCDVFGFTMPGGLPLPHFDSGGDQAESDNGTSPIVRADFSIPSDGRQSEAFERAFIE